MSRLTAADWQYVKRCSPALAYWDLLLKARRGEAKMIPEPRGLWRDKWYRRMHTKFVVQGTLAVLT